MSWKEKYRSDVTLHAKSKTIAVTLKAWQRQLLKTVKMLLYNQVTSTHCSDVTCETTEHFFIDVASVKNKAAGIESIRWHWQQPAA